MDLNLTGKTALVTGAASGIGAATARILAEEGADVVVSYGHNLAGAQETAQAVRSASRQAWLLAMDVADPASVAAAVASLNGLVTGIDLAILCAGRNEVTPLTELAVEEWDEVIRVNLSGTFYVLKAILPMLKDGAAVVTVASVAASTGAAHHAHYAAAKAGIINLTKSAARALAPRVRVNCVAPGLAETAMGAQTLATLDPDYATNKLLAQRIASPEEIARCIVFLASPAARFVYGATLDVNGGRDLR